MSRPSADTENTSDDEFEVESNTAEDASTALQRLKEFSYYLVENVELNLNLCLNLLEERTIPSKPNSIHVTVLSKLLLAVPKVGSGAGSAASKAETFILNKIQKKNSRTLADLVYYYSDHKDEMRKLLIESAVDVFYSFEHQFLKLSCNGGQKRAMQKLAIDASDRIFNYLIETEQKKDITRDEITKGILYGNSKRNNVGIREGKTVTHNEVKWKTCKLYKKTGIVIVEEQTFYRTKECHTEKYGHRRPLPWEQTEDIKSNWEQETGFEVPTYFVTVNEDLFKNVRDYIMTKTLHEEAKLERENYSNEALEDRKVKHEEVLTKFREHFKELIDDLEDQYKIICDNHNESKELLKEINEKQEEDKVVKEKINIKLQEIHEDIKETKSLVEVSTTIQKDITTIKHNHDELAKSMIAVSPENIEKLVKQEAIKDTGEKLKDFVKETLRRNDPGPRIRREVERNLKKLRIKF